MKIFFLLGLFSFPILAQGIQNCGNPSSCCAVHSARKPAKAEKWLESKGIKKKEFFASSSLTEEPVLMTVTVADWANVHKNPDREKANSKAVFQIDGSEFQGSIEARGQSRFNLYKLRALRLNIGESDFKLINHHGAEKGKRSESLATQDARVLMEYIAYKMYEVLAPQESFKTRLAKIRFQDAQNKVLDEGYAFFVEGVNGASKRLGYDKAGTAWDFNEESPGQLRSELFRRMILDRDDGNMPNNFLYPMNEGDTAATRRVPYDFDMSFLIPPYSMKLEEVSTEADRLGQWLKDVYQFGDTRLQYLAENLKSEKDPVKKQELQKIYNQQLNQFREEFKKEISHFLKNSETLRRLFHDSRIPQPYREVHANWYESVIKVMQSFSPNS